MPRPPQDAFGLARRYMADWTPKLIFDVGANVGQSAASYALQFPDAVIHCFEPSPATYGTLVEGVAQFPNVVTHCLALGRADAVLELTQGSLPGMNHLLAQTAPAQANTVQVQVRTGAGLFHGLKASRIDYLKIDTEGHDYDVLLGFLPVLDAVDFIEVEASMNPANKSHVPLRKFEDLLWHLGFHLFHIFELKMEWKRSGRYALRRCNAVFINGRLFSPRRPL